MKVFPDVSCSNNQLSTGSALRRVLHASMDGELSDDEFVRAIRGTCTQSEFVAAISACLHAEPNLMPRIIALLNRLNGRGDIPADLLRLLELRISRDKPAGANDGVTLDLGRNGVLSAGMADRDPILQRVEVGRVLRDRYDIQQCLGTGGKGSVFKALDRYRSSLPPSQRYVAIKLLHECPGNREETIAALRRELQSAQTLSHPNIVKVYDVDRDGDVDFFTMELLEGELLSDLMRRFHPAPMSRPHAWSIIDQIASGLEHAHSRSVVHADLKPQNIMITNSGEVRILDFGSSYRFAKERKDEPAWRGSMSATPAYACCELLDGRIPDPRDDLYALACIAYELLTGAHPFQRRRASEARDFGVVAARPSGLTRRQWRALSKGLSWHRAGRSISMGDWFKELKPASDYTQSLEGIGSLASIGSVPSIGSVASFGELKPAAPPVSAQLSPPLRPFAVFSVLLSIAAVSLLFVRLAPGGKVSGEALSAVALHEQTSRAIQIAEASRMSAPSALSTRAASEQSTASHASPILPSQYEVQRGQHFAEIRVHRPANAGSDAALTWWTVPDSAKPGVDYVSQGKVSQPFPKGQDSMSVFVKLLPKATRSRPEVFYVAVTDRGDRAVDQVTHTAVRLPSTENPF
jgi:serine/threonine protein kinase